MEKNQVAPRLYGLSLSPLLSPDVTLCLYQAVERCKFSGDFSLLLYHVLKDKGHRRNGIIAMEQKLPLPLTTSKSIIGMLTRIEPASDRATGCKVRGTVTY